MGAKSLFPFNARYSFQNVKKLLVNLICLFVIVTVVRGVINYNDHSNNVIQEDVAVVEKVKPKTILFWTKFYIDKSMFRTGDQQLFKEIGCKVTDCIITDDRHRFNESDAVIFHAFDMDKNDMPTGRHRNQRFVLYLLETIPHFRDKVLFFTNFTDNYFNWTMSFRRDADIHHLWPHGALRRKKSSPVAHFDTLPNRLSPGVRLPSSRTLMDVHKVEQRKRLANKTKLAAWFSSNCNSQGKREEYVRQLKQYIDLDIYGKCGDKECLPRNSHRCNNLLDEYKFYLSFENSLCPDYISEKFYRALERDVVPIVYGGGDYNQYAPPHSFIHVADFETPRCLADYLKLLDENDAMFLRYFEWKDEFEVDKRPTDGWCELCEKLHNSELPEKWYPSLAEWWYDSAPCYAGSEFIESLKKNSV